MRANKSATMALVHACAGLTSAEANDALRVPVVAAVYAAAGFGQSSANVGVSAADTSARPRTRSSVDDTCWPLGQSSPGNPHPL